MRIRILCAALCALLTSGCSTYSLEELRHTAPKGTPFQIALTHQYLEYASYTEARYDWFNSMHFADKGLLAAYGNDVAPENPGDWHIPEAAKPDLENARTALIQALTPEIIKREPERAAQAQLYFDCWVKEQEQSWQDDKIAHCHDGFTEALDDLKQAAKPSAQGGPETDAYIVFFDTGKTTLTEAGKTILDQVLQALETKQEKYEITLNGHADTVGTTRFNLILSQKRAQAVKKWLVDGGVEEKDIKIFAFGETDLPVATPDNTPEPANRRVEIFLNE